MEEEHLRPQAALTQPQPLCRRRHQTPHGRKGRSSVSDRLRGCQWLTGEHGRLCSRNTTGMVPILQITGKAKEDYFIPFYTSLSHMATKGKRGCTWCCQTGRLARSVRSLPAHACAPGGKPPVPEADRVVCCGHQGAREFSLCLNLCFKQHRLLSKSGKTISQVICASLHHDTGVWA